MSIAPGTLLGRYEVRSQIGSGGMGVVYRAWDTELHRTVALKVLPTEIASNADRMRRFVQEAKSASALNHPNIVTVHDVGRRDSIQFIVTEHIEGDTLRTRISRGPLPLLEVLNVSIQIASALAEAHQAGIIHRDIKPENIMLRRDGYVKVLDFGLAKLRSLAAADVATVTEAPFNTDPGVVLGTVAYMSPEQARGEDVDGRTDIWSFGVVLYEAVTGHRPFEGDSPSHTLVAILDREPPPLAHYLDGAPDSLQEIISDALTKDRDARFQTATQMLSKLRRLKQQLDAGVLVVVGSDSSHGTDRSRRSRSAMAAAPQPIVTLVGNLVRNIKRHTSRVTALTLLTIMAAAATVVVYSTRTWNSSERVAAALTATPLTSTPGVERSPAFSPDGRQIAYVASRAGQFDIFVQLIGAGEPLRLTNSPDAEMSPAWSPDGRFIAFLRGRGEGRGFYIIPALGGVERKLGDAYGWPFAGPMLQALDWSPDGKTLAIVDKSSNDAPWEIFLLSVDTGERQRLTTPPATSGGDRLVAFSPDGRALAFARTRHTADNTGQIYVVPITGGEPLQLTSEEMTTNSVAWTPNGAHLLFAAQRGGSNSTVWRIPAVGGTPTPVADLGDEVFEIAVARQGQRLIYAQRSEDINLWRLPLARTSKGPHAEGPPERFAASTRIEMVPQFSPDGRRVSFGSNRSGRFEIWVCNANGERAVRVTDMGGAHQGPPRWSPDSRTLAFDSDVGGSMDIYVVSADGGTPRRLTTETSREITPNWSHDGQWIYFTSDRAGRPEVWKIPSQGGTAIQVTVDGGSLPSESPDRLVIYFERAGPPPTLWQVPVDGSGATSAAINASILASPHSWAIAQTGIYFLQRPSAAVLALKFFEFATRRIIEVVTLEQSVPLPRTNLAVSPDERWVLYEQRDRLEYDLMLVENFR